MLESEKQSGISLAHIAPDTPGIFIDGVKAVDPFQLRIFESSCKALGLIPLLQQNGEYHLVAPGGLHAGIACELETYLEGLAFSNPALTVRPFQVRRF